MIIEIRKVGFTNKGAELMLHVILRKTREACPDAKFVMVPNPSRAPFEKITELGLYPKLWPKKNPVFASKIAGFISPRTRKRYGLFLDEEIDVVLDAAGFSYSDQWGDGSSRELAVSCKRWKKNGVKVVLLPQAFGPFTSPAIKKAIKTIADNANLIFARDPVSYRHLVGVAGERPNIKMAPDFTNLIEGVLPDDFDIEKNRFCIVPNYRMIDKTSPETSEAYLPFMAKCAQRLWEERQRPFLLIHEDTKDVMLAEKIRKAAGGDLPIVKEKDPLKIKGILGACEGVIGSRFHSLVNALSQNVPTLGTGWSHKYKMLFADYGFEEGLLDVTAEPDVIHKKIDLIVQPESRRKIKSIIIAKSDSLKQQSQKMWEDVLAVILKN